MAIDEERWKDLFAEAEHRAFNNSMCERYPFLKMWDEDEDDYSVTWRDCVPFGWIHVFDLMCDEILSEIEGTDLMYKFHFVEVKEKFGELRIYTDNSTPRIDRIIDEWSFLSGFVCEECGNPNVRIMTGWVTPICYKCWAKHNSHDYERFINSTKQVMRKPVLEITRYSTSGMKKESIDLSKKFRALVEDYHWDKEGVV